MAKQVVENPKKRQFLFNPLKRPLPYIGFLIALLIIVFQSSIRQYTANIVGGWLVSNIRESTEGNYLLNYDYVRFDIFTKELRIQNLDLVLDTARIDENTYLEHNNNLIYLSTPVVVLKLRSIWDLIFNDKLAIAYIGMKEPKVRLTRSEAISEVEKEEKQKAANSKLRSYLEELQVDSFRVADGSFEVELQDENHQTIINFKIGDLSTFLKGFRLDNIDPGKAFHGIYAEEFELRILDQEVSLPKLNHRIGFKQLWISSVDSIVQLDTLQIKPMAGNNTQISADIEFKQFTVSGLDFKRAYLKDELDIGNVLVANPKVKIKGTAPATSAEKEEWHYLLFNMINLQEFSIVNGDIDIDLGSKIIFKDLGLTVDNYQLDSTYTNIEGFRKSLNNFHFDVSNSIIELPDSIHRLEIGHLYLSSLDSIALLNNLRVNPIPDRRQYSLYKKQGARFISYSSIKNVILSGVNFQQIINDGHLLVDTIIVANPDINITEYPYITTKKKGNPGLKPFLLNAIALNNGRFKFNRRQGGKNHLSELSGINIKVRNLYNASESSISYDTVDFQINSGYSQISNIGHTLSFKGVKGRNFKDFDITQLSLKPDSLTGKGEKINVSATFVRLRGFDLESLRNNKTLNLNALTIQKVRFNGDFRNKKTKTVVATKKSAIENIFINKFYIRNADFDLKTKDNEIVFNDITTKIDTLHFNSLATKRESPVEFKDIILSHGNFRISSNKDKFHLSGKFGRFAESDSIIKFQELSVHSANKLKGKLGSLTLAGLNRKILFKQRALKFKTLIAESPELTITTVKTSQKAKNNFIFNSDSIKSKILANIAYIEFDSILLNKANLTISSKDRISKIKNATAHIGKYVLNNSSKENDLLKPGRLELTIDKISTTGKTDTITIANINLDLIKHRLFTGTIEATSFPSPNKINIHSPGIMLSGFSTELLINGDFSLDTIRLANTHIEFITPKKSKKAEILDKAEQARSKAMSNVLQNIFKNHKNLMLDSMIRSVPKSNIIVQYKPDTILNQSNFTKLFGKIKEDEKQADISPNVEVKPNIAATPKVPSSTISSTNGTIKHILVNNSTFSLVHERETNHYVNRLNFSISLDTLVLDTLNKFNLYKHVHNLTLSVNDYKINLPDSLNTISFDQLKLSTRNGDVAIKGFELEPRVGKFEYAKIKGFQTSWQHLAGLDIHISNLDMFNLVLNKELYARRITTTNGSLEIFKDKELPIPVNKRMPMPQDAIKNLSMPVYVDSVVVEDLRIDFSSRLSSTNPEGSINFQNLNARVSNITNIDSLILVNPYTLISANTKMMGEGFLTANFNFDLNDENNGFIFDAHLGSMEARSLSNILEALAFVKIESGKIKDLNLEAKGDNYYAMGNMRFVYNNLKVSTINKKNLKTKGMGKVIKTFFANAFVVKKNNPSFKFFPRDGAMYFERDPQKIIIDYITKTALSGVISSIGARNMRKDIKKIQRESKKQKDEERKALKKANRKEGNNN